MKDFKGMPALDARLLPQPRPSSTTNFPIRRTFHLADELRYGEAVDLLEVTLQEEKNTDKTLTGIAKSVVNIEAEEDEEEDA